MHKRADIIRSVYKSDHDGIQAPESELRNNVRIRKASFWSTYRGVLLAVVSGVAYATCSALVKGLYKRSPADKAFYVSLTSTIFALPAFILSYGVKVDRFGFGLIVLGGFCISLATQSRYQALKMLPIGDASAILFNTPIFVAILARIFLKEKISRVTMVSILFSVVGLCLVAKLPVTIWEILQGDSSRFGTFEHTVGCAYAFGSVISYGFFNVLMRKMRTVNECLVNFLRALSTVIFSAMLSPVFTDAPFQSLVGDCSNEAWVFVTFGLFGPIYTFCNITAMKYEQASTVSIIIMSVDIFLGFLVQVVIFRDVLNAYSCSGAILVFLSGLFIAFRKWLTSKPKDSYIRKKLSWIEK